ncbi:MAG: hypothetical protein PHV07_08245 [Oscillospiraceae bacterium]|nr:hypothetical protein [Oscillospiraceae bacterium]
MPKLFSELMQFGIESVAIDMKGCRSCEVVYDGNTFDEWYNEQAPEDKYFFSFNGKIVGRDKSCEDIAQIGHFWGTYINGEELSIDDEYTFFEACDMCNFAKAITNKDGMIDSDVRSEWDRIVYLDRIYLMSTEQFANPHRY